ncbi:MAG: DUF2442 domain-containing protein [bacterium]
MKSKIHGKSISEIEVLNIDKHGFWLLLKGKEYFLPYSDFPWFLEARIKDINKVELLHDSHIYWQNLDIDLDVKILESLENYPLIYK